MKSPTLVKTLQRIIENSKQELHTALPGEIITYNATKRLASVKPLVSRKLRDGRVFEMPVVNNVPVVLPGTSEAVISLPIKKGDGVLLVFSERSIDEFLSNGGVTSPVDLRTHDLSDAIAIPGLFYFGVDNGASSNDLEVKFKQSSITLKSNGDITVNAGPVGKIAIGNASAELIDIIDQLLTALASTTVATALGPQPLSSSATISALEVQLLLLKGVL